MTNAFEYIRLNGGVMTSIDYPLGDWQYPCKYNYTMKAVEVSGYVRLPSFDEELLKDALAAIGPIAVAIDGSQDPFFSYWTGVFDIDFCSQYANHAVLLVGYGVDPDFGPYWIAKNSWCVMILKLKFLF